MANAAAKHGPSLGMRDVGAYRKFVDLLNIHEVSPEPPKASKTAFAGLWGMNFKHMPELDWYYGYPLALFIIAGACAFLYWRFKKSGWL